MSDSEFRYDRRSFIAGIAVLAVSVKFAGSAWAKGAGLGSLLGSGGLSDLLGRASDSSLDKLGQPGAFYGDTAVRIALPMVGGMGKSLSSVLRQTDKLGLTDGVVRKLNDAAGLAAKEAKPVFRTAISRLTLNDVPGIVGQNDGATQYLQRSAGTELKGSVRPLIDKALGDVGAFAQIDKLVRKSPMFASLGLNRDLLGNSVTDQALSGIFKYIGAEEGRLRANPLGAASGLLKGAIGN